LLLSYYKWAMCSFEAYAMMHRSAAAVAVYLPNSRAGHSALFVINTLPPYPTNPSPTLFNLQTNTASTLVESRMIIFPEIHSLGSPNPQGCTDFSTVLM
ncbi:hypothetical protein J6590_100902, partial [Homalodisca vitripennis]